MALEVAEQAHEVGRLSAGVLGLDLRPVAVLGDVDDERGLIGTRGLSSVELGIVELERRDVTARASDFIEARSAGGPRIDQAGVTRRPDDGGLELRQVGDDGRQHPGIDLERHAVLIDVVPRALAVRTCVERAVAHRELDAIRQETLMDVQRLLHDVAQGGLMALPAKRTDRQVRIDAFDGAGVHRAVGVGADAAERDALRDERLLHAVSLRPRALACARRLGLQLGAHLAREAGDRTEAEEMGSIALIRAARHRHA